MVVDVPALRAVVADLADCASVFDVSGERAYLYCRFLVLTFPSLSAVMLDDGCIFVFRKKNRLKRLFFVFGRRCDRDARDNSLL